MRVCGTCTMCCKLLDVPALHKPPNAWCPICNKGKGCATYETRPQSCKDFACLWLQDETVMERLRPDISRVVIEPLPKYGLALLIIDPTRPDAWRGKDLNPIITRLLQEGMGVVTTCGPGSQLNFLVPFGQTVQQMRGRLDQAIKEYHGSAELRA